MTQKSLTTLVLSASLALASPVLAQDALAKAPTVAEQQPPGTRVDETSGGFQLVTHGVWAQPANAWADAPKPAIPVQPSTAAQHRQRDSKRNSNFRRAAYLPHVYAAEARYGLPPACWTR